MSRPFRMNREEPGDADVPVRIWRVHRLACRRVVDPGNKGSPPNANHCMLPTWNPVTPVLNDVVSLAVYIIRVFSSSLAISSCSLVPNLVFGFKNREERFFNTIEHIVIINTRTISLELF